MYLHNKYSINNWTVQVLACKQAPSEDRKNLASKPANKHETVEF